LAVAFVSAGALTFTIYEYGRLVDDRRRYIDERRRLAAELREVHHAVKTAQLRMRAHQTVRTYGEQIRDSVFPAVAQLGGVISDLPHTNLKPQDAEKYLKEAQDYLKELTDEYEKEYLPASLLQEAEHKWRQHRLNELVKDPLYADCPPDRSTIKELVECKGGAWKYLNDKEQEDKVRFPRLAIFLDVPHVKGTVGAPQVGGKVGMTQERLTEHQEKFSSPIRTAMNLIDS
jgi:hypothetical protein